MRPRIIRLEHYRADIKFFMAHISKWIENGPSSRLPIKPARWLLLNSAYNHPPNFPFHPAAELCAQQTLLLKFHYPIIIHESWAAINNYIRAMLSFPDVPNRRIFRGIRSVLATLVILGFYYANCKGLGTPWCVVTCVRLCGKTI